MSFIQNIKPYAEIGYYFAGIILAIAAAIGLYQIWISRSDIRWRKERAKLEKAVEYSDIFESKFIPLIEEFHKKCSDQNVFLYDYQEIKDFEKPIISKDTTLPRVVMQGWRHALNLLDTISASFVIGLADEKVGYSMIGPSVNRRDILRGNRRVDLRAGWRASLCEGACQEGVKGAPSLFCAIRRKGCPKEDCTLMKLSVSCPAKN